MVLGIRERVCYELARRRIRPPEESATTDHEAYKAWRTEALAHSWRHFDDRHVAGRDVVDFGSGKGNLVFFLADKGPRSITGVELHGPSVQECRDQLEREPPRAGVRVAFEKGEADHIPLPDGCCDTLIAFDVVEHIMAPETILAEWHRVVRPGGRVLIDWVPYRSPWAPHMESLVPIPWAHVIFGEKALFRTCERIYDSPEYVHRKWDLDERGAVLPNKWRRWSSFEEQGYINGLNVRPFLDLVRAAGFSVDRFEHHTFSSLPARDVLAPVLLRVPVLKEYLTSYVIAELVRG